MQILCDRDSRAHAREENRGGDESRDDEVHIGHRSRLTDRASEDVPEDDQEHHPLQRAGDDQLRRSKGLFHGPPGDRERRGDEPGALSAEYGRGKCGRCHRFSPLRRRRGFSALSVVAAWPVSERKTSSSVGRRSVRSSISIPASVRRVAATASEPGPSEAATEKRWVAASISGAPSPRPVSAATASKSPSPSRVRSSTRSVPAWLFSSPGLPSAMTRPWSMITIRAASWSASSRYWVVSTT